jgi:hypothetical protein
MASCAAKGNKSRTLGQSKPNATKQDQDDDGGQDANDESGCKPNWQGETASCGVSELHLALVGNIFPSSRHQFLGALVVGSVELCRKLPTVLGKLSILGNCFHALRLRPPGAAEQAGRASQPANQKKAPGLPAAGAKPMLQTICNPTARAKWRTHCIGPMDWLTV